MQLTQTTSAFAIAAALATPAAFAETTTGDTIKAALKPTSNWEGSLIVEGIYFDSNKDEAAHEEGEGEEGHDHEHAHLPGFPSGGHDHGMREGLHTGHIEAVVSGNINDKLKARVTTGIMETEDEGLEMELEEAFVETRGLGNGVTVKAGRFFSDVGYLSSKHNHEWDFADNPLVYKGMFGAHTNDDGVQLSYVAPTDTFVQVGAELFRGDKFPASDSDDTVGAATVFAKTGGDIGTDHSWQAGVGHWRADSINNRLGELHEHERPDGSMHSVTPGFSGKSRINTVNATYKWAPNGNAKERSLKLQAEYFQRDEDGAIDMLNTDGGIERTLNYGGKQDGYYVQGVYQFRPHWRVGLRHDHLGSDNTLTQASGAAATEHQVEAAGLATEGHTPKRNSLMVDYSPREYSRLRLQFNEDKSTPETDRQVILQYTHSFGSHGAHGF
ncbi:porin [Thiothrix nivea]|uniref:TonB-dependent receptor n=1 Tax=Thiothrix nivea (strain ATCC 35100 / DSM 5205 / JP2) TaxID=870187 RepID=A0A656HDV7_THINJ|nr:porin [Thiothrix nivea]EIJ33620.1 hypothetical protein Thini_0995 [Thiothrix nivea DSM 5205]